MLKVVIFSNIHYLPYTGLAPKPPKGGFKAEYILTLPSPKQRVAANRKL
jgi:hypothetical protein